jgi:hypothetical protein
MWASSVIKKTDVVNNRPMGKNSPNLVTLKANENMWQLSFTFGAIFCKKKVYRGSML